MASASNHSSTSSANGAAGMPRRQSLRLPPQPPQTPIPPSLRQSPYLNAPIFKRDIPTPNLPSEEDEKWLQDTIPISSSSSTSVLEGGSGSAKVHADRRGSVVKQPPKHAEDSPSYFHQPSFPHSGHLSLYSEQNSPPVSNRSRSHSTQQKYLSHSLAPFPDAPLTWSANPKTGNRPAFINQAHSEPDVGQMGSHLDHHSGYFPRVLP